MSVFIGLDVGTVYTKIAVLEKKNHVKRLIFFKTPYKGTMSSEIDDAAFIKQITENISKEELASSQIAVNVPAASIFVMIVDLPKMSKKELGVAAISEAKRKMVPPPGVNSFFEYKVLGEKIVENVAYNEVLVVKTENIYVNRFINFFTENKYQSPVLISPDAIVIAENLKNSSERKFCAVVDIGYDSTKVFIVKVNDLCFYRDIKFGLRNIYEHFSRVINVPVGEIEAIIREKGVPLVDFDLSDKVNVAEEIMRQKYEESLKGEEQKTNLLELRVLWEEDLQRMISEIRRSLYFYKQQYSGERIENFIFLGGGSIIKGLVEEIAKAIGGKCELIDVFKGISYNQDYQEIAMISGPIFSQAVSLAVSITETAKKSDSINFVPQKIKQFRRTVQRQYLTVFIIIFFIVINFLSGYVIFMDYKGKEKQINDIDMEIKKYGDAINILNNLDKAKKTFIEKEKEVNKIISERVITPGILKLIVNYLPKEAVLVSFKISKKIQNNEGLMGDGMGGGMPNSTTGKAISGAYQVYIETLMFENYEKSKNIMENFCERLGNNKNFSNIKLLAPVQEEVSPTFEGGGIIALSAKKERKFNITADIER